MNELTDALRKMNRAIMAVNMACAAGKGQMEAIREMLRVNRENSAYLEPLQ